MKAGDGEAVLHGLSLSAPVMLMDAGAGCRAGWCCVEDFGGPRFLSFFPALLCIASGGISLKMLC